MIKQQLFTTDTDIRARLKLPNFVLMKNTEGWRLRNHFYLCPLASHHSTTMRPTSIPFRQFLFCFCCLVVYFLLLIIFHVKHLVGVHGQTRLLNIG